MDISKLVRKIKEDIGAYNVMSESTMAVVGAGILLMLAVYIVTVLSTNLADENVTLVKEALVNGFLQAAGFPGLVLIFVFIAVILNVLQGVQGGRQ